MKYIDSCTKVHLMEFRIIKTFMKNIPALSFHTWLIEFALKQPLKYNNTCGCVYRTEAIIFSDIYSGVGHSDWFCWLLWTSAAGRTHLCDTTGMSASLTSAGFLHEWRDWGHGRCLMRNMLLKKRDQFSFSLFIQCFALDRRRNP